MTCIARGNIVPARRVWLAGLTAVLLLCSSTALLASPDVHIITSLPVDTSAGDGTKTVHLLDNIGTTETDSFSADTPDTPTPDYECTISGGPYYTWTLTPSGSVASISPPDQSSTTFTASSANAIRTTYTLTVECYWMEVSDDESQPEEQKVGDTTDSLSIDMSFVKPGLQIRGCFRTGRSIESCGGIPPDRADTARLREVVKQPLNANGNWENVEGKHLILLDGTIYEFKYSTDVSPPVDASGTTWSGIASGSGATIEVTFDSDCQNQALTASLAGISKSVTIDVITPSIASMKFKNNFPIYDPSTGSAFPFAGYDSYPSATRNPTCIKFGSNATVQVEFWNSSALTYATAITIQGNEVAIGDSFFGSMFTGNSKFGTSWRSPSPPAQLTSAGAVASKLRYCDGGEFSPRVDWTYQVPSPSGTGAWIAAGTVDQLTVCLTYNSPRYRHVSGTGWVTSQFQPSDFTLAHIELSIDSASPSTNPLTSPTPQSIATAIITNIGSRSVLNDDPDDYNIVDKMLQDYIGENTQCRGYATALSYMLCCLGVDNANVATANLNHAICDDGSFSGTTKCPATNSVYKLQGVVAFVAWKGNAYQGCTYLQGASGSTVCYDAEHGYVKRYWELGNSTEVPPNYPRPGASGTGTLYFYRWGTNPDSGTPDWISTNLTVPPTDSAGNPLSPATVNYAGN